MSRKIKYQETKNGVICGYCGWKIDKPSDSQKCLAVGDQLMVENCMFKCPPDNLELIEHWEQKCKGNPEND